MFLAFKKAFGEKATARQVAGLFLFEFVVVLLGVLAAQSLQAAYVSRQAKEMADEAVKEHRSDLSDFANFAEFQLRGYSCQIAYLRRLREAAVSGRKPEDLPFRPPAEPTVWVAPWDNETRRAVRRFYGEEILVEHALFERYSTRLKQRRHDSMLDWGVVSLINFPDFADDAVVKSEIQLALGRLLALRVDIRSIANSVDIKLEGRGYEVDEGKLSDAMKTLVDCEQPAHDARAKAG